MYHPLAAMLLMFPKPSCVIHDVRELPAVLKSTKAEMTSARENRLGNINTGYWWSFAVAQSHR
jgi:hypothetical protein